MKKKKTFNRNKDHRLLRLQLDLVFRKHERQFYRIYCPIGIGMNDTGLALNFVRLKRCKSICIWWKRDRDRQRIEKKLLVLNINLLSEREKRTIQKCTYQNWAVELASKWFGSIFAPSPQRLRLSIRIHRRRIQEPTLKYSHISPYEMEFSVPIDRLASVAPTNYAKKFQLSQFISRHVLFFFFS